MLRVVKVGGSLLEWNELPTALHQWLDEQPPAANVLICGGGQLANGIRDADQRFHLGNETAHWLAVDCMSLTARLLAHACNLPLEPLVPLVSLVPKLRLGTTSPLVPKLRLGTPAREALLREPQTPPTTNTKNTIVLDIRDFLHSDEPSLPAPSLPRDWTTTSDSIAARLAEALTADELVLLKSTSPPAQSLADLAASGYVDRHFPVAAARLTALRFINLKALRHHQPAA